MKKQADGQSAPGYQNPVRFFLSVAGYVVKLEPPNFISAIKFRNIRKANHFRINPPFYVRLLFRHEPHRSSLPSDWKPQERLRLALSGPFCSRKMMVSVLSAPLSPSATFPVWVRLWVRTQKRGELPTAEGLAGPPAPVRK